MASQRETKKLPVIVPREIFGEHMDGSYHIVSTNEADLILGGDAIIDRREEIKILFRYPMLNEVTFTCRRNGGWTLKEMALEVSRRYEFIYAEEARTTTQPEDYLPQMLNRNSTCGIYGIQFHVISDLYLEGVVLMEDGTWKLIVGS